MKTRHWWHHYPAMFRPIWVLAEATGRPERTFRTWIRRGKLTSACDLKTRELLIHAPEAIHLHQHAHQR